MSGPGSQDRQTLQPLQPPVLELWLLMVVRPPCCAKLGLLSSASSARAQEMQLLMPSSQMQAQGVQVARQVQWHYRQNPDRKMSADQKTLRSSLCQQFFPATSPHLVAKESGANMHPWRTPYSIVNHALSDWDARMQLTEIMTEIKPRVGSWSNWPSCLTILSFSQHPTWMALYSLIVLMCR